MDRVLDGVREWLPDRLAELARQHRVPGAAVAVLAGDEIAEAAYGVLSKATGVEATTDSVFQIGSVTKPWTASLVMQLVDEGSVDLDAPACRYLPDFRVADEWASTEITIRHLACHVAGFEGDIWTDTAVATTRSRSTWLPSPGRRSCSHLASGSRTTTPVTWCSGGSSRCCETSPTPRRCATT